jgi:hypothetical protein
LCHWRCDPSGDDHFACLPNALLLITFIHIGNGRCSLVSCRFHELIPLVDSVHVCVDCIILDEPPSSSSPPDPSSPMASVRARGIFPQITRVVLDGVVKPIQALGVAAEELKIRSRTKRATRGLNGAATCVKCRASHTIKLVGRA